MLIINSQISFLEDRSNLLKGICSMMIISTAVTMDIFSLKMKGILENKSLEIHIDDRKLNLEEKSFSRQNLLQDTTFSTFSKILGVKIIFCFRCFFKKFNVDF